jgi:hypothetical protein
MPKQESSAVVSGTKPTTTLSKGFKKNRHGRCFKTHLRQRNDAVIEARKAAFAVQLANDLAARKAAASAARLTGATLAYPFGGSYDIVAAGNKQVRSDAYLEANHSPPCDAYTGTPYASSSYGSRPAHAMLFYHHRAPRGSTGGLTSTGGSSFNKPWAEILREHMLRGDFARAMYLDFNDILATTTPNRGYYALALHRSALYARYAGFIDETGLQLVTTLYGHLLTGDAFGMAFTDADEAH